MAPFAVDLFMNETVWHALLWLGVGLPSAMMIAAGLMPSSLANAHVKTARTWITRLAGIQFALAVIVAVGWVIGGAGLRHAVLLEPSDATPLGLSVHYDGISSLMLALVSFVGWSICRYSIRYLDGEPGQGRYFRWTALTIGAVSLMVISGNLLMFVAAWVMTSLGLHQLLLQYGDRPEARRAAWTKFTISRVGDVALITASVLIFRVFGTWEFDQLFAAAEATRLSGASGSDAFEMKAIGWLIMLGAVTKSAQVPFHSWLPLTMETPTPVSALMHAGIVNAGGYLIIRTSPLVAMSPTALATLAAFGGVTACFAAIVMMTQTSVKRSLAYSTIAQMGFMMLQCGLGAFSAAMLHILAHSLYKAHAFLGSGSVIDRRASTLIQGMRSASPVGGVQGAVEGAVEGAGDADPPVGGLMQRWTDRLILIASFLITMTLYFGVMSACGISPAAKPGGYILGFTLCLAMTYWIGRAFASDRAWVIGVAVASTAGLLVAYALGYLVVDRLIGSRTAAVTTGPLVWMIAGIVLLGFGGLFVLNQMLAGQRRSPKLDAFYVHASNGFYIDGAARRLWTSMSGRRVV